jgi:predicted ATP-binding protein involved in virulence
MKKNTNTRKVKLPGDCCKATYKGIVQWYKSVFEQLGWMILAKEQGMTDKVTTYVNSIYRIHIAIHQKIKSTVDKDRIQDLEIMGDNIKVLLAHVQKDFKQ